MFMMNFFLATKLGSGGGGFAAMALQYFDEIEFVLPFGLGQEAHSYGIRNLYTCHYFFQR